MCTVKYDKVILCFNKENIVSPYRISQCTYIYVIKQIPKMDILYSRYSRKNKKTTKSVIFRLYSKDIVKPIDYIQTSCAIYNYKVQSRLVFS